MFKSRLHISYIDRTEYIYELAETNFDNVFNTKALDDFNKRAKDSWDQFIQTIQISTKDAGERKVQTNRESGEKYITTFKMDGDIINEFPNKLPQSDDEYWKRHSVLVDKVMKERMDIINKVIETVGTTIKGLINPIQIGEIDLPSLLKGSGSNEKS